MVFSLGGFAWVPLAGTRDAISEREKGSRVSPGHKTAVCIVRTSRVWNGSRLNQQVIKEMVDQGIVLLSGMKGVSKSWNKFFYPTDTIALKVNPIARHTGSTKPEVCYALAETIHENVGIPYDRFIIFDVNHDDLRGAGYILSQEKGRVQVVSSLEYSKIVTQGEVKARISRIITDGCSALVNVPLLKTHIASGISVALKNHYGSIDKEVVRNDLFRYHADGFKNLVYLNLMPPIREKERLIVVDGLMAQYHKGPDGDPRYQWRFNGIIMGTDPVAVDTVCLRVINEKRTEDSLIPIRLAYLDLAREEGLGTNSLGEILVFDKAI